MSPRLGIGGCRFVRGVIHGSDSCKEFRPQAGASGTSSYRFRGLLAKRGTQPSSGPPDTAWVSHRLDELRDELERLSALGSFAPRTESEIPCLVFAATKQESAMSLGNEIDDVFRREVKTLPAYEKAQAASGSGIGPPVDEMNHLLMGLVIATQRSFHLLADRIEQIENAKAR